MEQSDKQKSGVETPPVIHLDDLTTGAEAELGRLKATIATLRREIGDTKSENSRLAANCDKLNDQLREVRQALARLGIKELRELERSGGSGGWRSLLQSLTGDLLKESKKLM
jgi:chromosome segregation ATPase